MKYIITYHPEFGKNAIKEILRICGEASYKKMVPSISLVEIPENEEGFLEKLVHSQPIFIRHIMPVQAMDTVVNDMTADCAVILTQAKGIVKIREGQFFSVQCRMMNANMEYSSKDIEVLIGTFFERQGGIPQFSDFQIQNNNSAIISVLICENRFYIGYSKAAENLNSHSDEHRILSRGGREISRAENKLKEAICKFNLVITGKGLALDIGASPGGWTKVLADYGYMVTAVDPGKLHPSLESYKNVKHLQDKVENLVFQNRFSMIVNDMNVDPQITSQIMCDMWEWLGDDGMAIVTLKLPFCNIERELEESKEILSRRYQIAAIKSLTHNRREVTVLLRKKNAI